MCWTFTASLWALFKLPPLPLLPRAGGVQRAGFKSVLEGFVFLGTRKNVRMRFLVDMCAMVFALPRALLPAIGAVPYCPVVTRTTAGPHRGLWALFPAL